LKFRLYVKGAAFVKLWPDKKSGLVETSRVLSGVARWR